MFGKFIDGNLEMYKMPIKTDRHIFTTDETIILSNGYKPVRYTHPEEREGYFACGFTWVETDTEIVQEWIYGEADNSEYNYQ